MLQEFVVIREDDSLLGVAGLQIFGSVALVRSVGVDAAHRSRSLGSSLLAAIEARARQRSVKQLYLLTKDAQLFFYKHGYTELSRCSAPAEIQGASQFGASCCASAILMSAMISASMRCMRLPGTRSNGIGILQETHPERLGF